MLRNRFFLRLSFLSLCRLALHVYLQCYNVSEWKLPPVNPHPLSRLWKHENETTLQHPTTKLYYCAAILKKKRPICLLIQANISAWYTKKSFEIQISQQQKQQIELNGDKLNN